MTDPSRDCFDIGSEAVEVSAVRKLAAKGGDDSAHRHDGLCVAESVPGVDR